MKDLLEKLDELFAGEPKQKRGDPLSMKEKMDMISPVLGADYKKHPASGRLVGAGGAAEELEETLEELAERFRKELEEYGADGSGMSSATLQRPQYREREAADKMRNIELDSQEDSIEQQIKGLNQQQLAVSKQPTPLPNPKDPASIIAYAQASRDKKAQRSSLEQQKRSLAAQLAKITPYAE